MAVLFSVTENKTGIQNIVEQTQARQALRNSQVQFTKYILNAKFIVRCQNMLYKSFFAVNFYMGSPTMLNKSCFSFTSGFLVHQMIKLNKYFVFKSQPCFKVWCMGCMKLNQFSVFAWQGGTKSPSWWIGSTQMAVFGECLCVSPNLSIIHRLIIIVTNTLLILNERGPC